MVFPTADELAVQIEHPEALPWTVHNHFRRFPDSFKATVVAVMKCHHRYQRGVAALERDAACRAVRLRATAGEIGRRRRARVPRASRPDTAPPPARPPAASREQAALEPACGGAGCSGRSNSPATQDDMDDEAAYHAQTNLGDLPKDLIFEILSRAAPYVADIRRISREEVDQFQRGGAD